jgi:quinol-cytochrome oxidoreductase complex cytochrome b subunit
MIEALRQWWGQRVTITGDQLMELTNEPVPYHMKRWWFCLGGTPAYLFVVQVVTGILLAFYYEPSTAAAYQSVGYITNEVTYGWFFRSLHKWAATLMIAAVILHQMRVYFTCAYRPPRDLNWMVGMGLLLCTLGMGFTGYSLVFEQLSYWGATVGANISREVPVVGDIIARMILGGDEYSSHTLTRLYVFHVMALPICMVGLMAIHIAFIRMQGISELSFEDEPENKGKSFNFFPDHVYTELIMGLILMIILSALATIEPAGLGSQADPFNTPEVIKPEWFFFASFRWLKLFSATFAVLSMGLIIAIMFLWPWIDVVIRRITKREDISIWIGVVVATTIIGMTVWEAIVQH